MQNIILLVCAVDIFLINLKKEQANMIQVALFSGTHTHREREISQGQTNSSPKRFVLK